MTNGIQDQPGPIHPVRTRRSQHQYFFYDKHHRPGASDAAQWLLEPDLTRDEEFQVFDLADFHEIADENDNLYGIGEKNDGIFPILGTRGQQVACFPATRPPNPWHGYPTWPLETRRQGDRLRPVPTAALTRMVEVELITASEKRRLSSEKHI